MSNFLPNLGGPGWIADVLTIKVEFDEEPVLVRDIGKKFSEPKDSFTGTAPLFSTKSVIRGKVLVSAPPNASVKTLQINIRLNEYVTFLDPYVTNELQDASTPENISKEDLFIEGTVSLPFEIDLCNVISAVTDVSGVARPFVDDYYGGMFGIKHNLVVTVERPFYTFPVIHHVPVVIHTVLAAPLTSLGRSDQIKTEDEFENLVADELAQALVGCTLEEQQSEEHCDEQEQSIRVAIEEQIKRDRMIANHQLLLVDIPATTFIFDYICDCVNIGDSINGVLAFENLTIEIHNVLLYVFKTEYVDGVMEECLVLEKSLMEEIREKQVEVEGDLIIEDEEDEETSFFERLSPSIAPLPSNTSENVLDDKLSVSYFLKLAVERFEKDGGDIFWVTNEIYFFRKDLPEAAGLPVGADAGGSAV